MLRESSTLQGACAHLASAQLEVAVGFSPW